MAIEIGHVEAIFRYPVKSTLLAEFGRRILLWGSLNVALYLRMPILARSLSSYHLQLRGEVAY